MGNKTKNASVEFTSLLIEDERSRHTVEKYTRDVRTFLEFVGLRRYDRADVLAYKAHLIEKYAPASVNSMLSSLNAYFSRTGQRGMQVKLLKIQRGVYLSGEKELTKAEYDRLLAAAKARRNERLYLIMQAICSTGIRVSELRFITAEAIERERAEVDNKGKRRTVFLPRELCRLLKAYCREQKIAQGSVFVTRNGHPVDRSNIWSDMKKLCKDASVDEKKVFPHNLRHLFARTYYSMQKDIVRLADLLGHSSVNTTRIYTMESGETHRAQIQKLGLLRL